MATDYAGLQQEVITWCVRDGDTAFAALVPAFISDAERRIAQDLRIRILEQVATTTVADPEGWIALPGDYREIRSARSLGATGVALGYVTPQRYASLSAGSTSYAAPTVFTVIGSQMRVFPVPDPTAGVQIELVYYGSPAALSPSNPTNRLLLESPQLYRYAALMEACVYLGDDDGIGKYASAYKVQLDNLHKADVRAEYPGMSAIQTDNVF